MHPNVALLILRGYRLFELGDGPTPWTEEIRIATREGVTKDCDVLYAPDAYTTGWVVGAAASPDYYTEIPWSEMPDKEAEQLPMDHPFLQGDGHGP